MEETQTYSSFACLECGRRIGADHGVDGYKHILNCLHLPDKGSAFLLQGYRYENPETESRVKQMLRLWTGRSY